jgi:hypothetical protein
LAPAVVPAVARCLRQNDKPRGRMTDYRLTERITWCITSSIHQYYEDSSVRQEFLMLADGAESTNGKIYILGGGSDRHLASAFPTLLKADLAVGVLVDWGEANRQHAMTINIMDEDGRTAARMEVNFNVGRPATAVPGQDLRVLIAVKGPFPIPQRGGYRAQLELDGTPQEPPFRFWVEPADLGPRPVAGPAQAG